MDRKLPDNPRAEQAFAYYAGLDPKERKYAFVAKQFDVSLPTVKLWASRGKWRQRAVEKDVTASAAWNAVPEWSDSISTSPLCATHPSACAAVPRNSIRSEK